MLQTFICKIVNCFCETVFKNREEKVSRGGEKDEEEGKGGQGGETDKSWDREEGGGGEGRRK